MGEWDKPETTDDDSDPGFVGGGGPAEEIKPDSDAELDEHGDNLTRADDGDTAA